MLCCVCRTADLVTDGGRRAFGDLYKPRPGWGYEIHPMETCLGAVLIVWLCSALRQLPHVNVNSESLDFLQKFPVRILVSLRYPGYTAEPQNKKRMILVGLNLHGKQPCKDSTFRLFIHEVVETRLEIIPFLYWF